MDEVVDYRKWNGQEYHPISYKQINSLYGQNQTKKPTTGFSIWYATGQRRDQSKLSQVDLVVEKTISWLQMLSN